MAQLLNNMNTAVFKLPLGMIRVIELPMAILAFATTSGYSSGQITVTNSNTSAPTICSFSFEYPFSFTGVKYSCCPNGPFTEGFKSSAEFFVFTGVIAFLYVLAIIGIYLLLWPSYENDSRFPMADFIGTAILALFWFAGSCAWASGVNGLKTITTQDAIKKQCAAGNVSGSWNYASLNVSLIAGFACFVLWAGNLWFIYKETAWFKARSGAGGPGPGVGAGGPPQPGGYSGQTTPTGRPGGYP